MQQPTDEPRNTMTDDSVIHLIQNANSVIIGKGLELLTMGLELTEDISTDFRSGSVSRSSYATLHGTANFSITRQLDWGRSIVRPYYIIESTEVRARFNLGAYYTSTPKRNTGEFPITYDVVGYDIIHGLADTVGEVYALNAGTNYLTAIEQILIERGYSRYSINQSASSKTLPTPKIWVMDERTTWLSIINDLLSSIGYSGVWSDWNGTLHCEPYVNPSDKGPEWYYTSDQATSMLGPNREIHKDFYDAPNRWVAVRSNVVDGATPVDGNGIYTYTNEFDGETSVSARGGRVITRYLSLEAADHASLVSQAQIAINADMLRKAKIVVSTFPNPLHWHFDRVLINDPALGPIMDALVTQWTLPLNGDDMSQEWSVL